MSARERFLEGLTTPSVSVLSIASAVLLALLASTAAWIGPERLGDGSPFARSPLDDLAYVSAAAVDLPERTGALVVLAGATGLREAVIPAKLGGGDVVDVSGPSVTLLETAAILEGLPNADGIVLVGVSPHRLVEVDNWRRALVNPRLVLPDGALETVAAAVDLPIGPRTGVRWLDERAFWLPRIPSAVRNGLIGGPRRAFASDGDPPARLGDRLDAEVLIGRLDAHAADGFALLAWICDRVRRSGLRPVLVESPRGAGHFGWDQARAFAVYDAEMAAFARGHGVEWLALDGDASLGPDDFYDPDTLRTDDARRRYTAALRARLR